MKKGILLFAIIAGSYLGLNSFVNGPAANGYDCTGAETGLGNPTGCSTGPTGCHFTGVRPEIALNIKIDSAGGPISFYTPGTTYTITVTGTHHVFGAGQLPKFGFQVGVISGDTSSPTAVNAGALQSTYLPFGVRYKAGNLANYRVNLVEHVFPIMATTGGGDTGSTYKEQFTWTAPVVGPQKVSIWGVMLLANGDSTAYGDYWDTAHISLIRRPIPASVSNEVASFGVSAAPNPVYNSLNLLFTNATAGTYEVSIYDMLGKKVADQKAMVNGLSLNVPLDASGWAPGMYVAVVENGGAKYTLQLVKN